MAYRKEYEVLYQTVQAFLKRCVVNNYSLLWPNSQYWTVKNLQDIKGRMIDNAIMGDSKSFEDKLKEQMAGATPELWGIICDIYFVYFLPSSSMKYKKKRGDILKACEYGKLTPPPENSEIWKALKSGFTRTSMRYHTKYGQFWLLILFALSIKNYSDSATEVDDSKRVQQILDSCLQGIEAKNDRAWDMRHALLYMAYPNNYERMISSRDKNRVFERYRDLIDESKTTDLDERVLAIRKALSEKYDKGDVLFDFYEDLKSEWRPTKQKIRDDSKKDELSVRSWSRPDGMDNLIGIKQIDLSVFRYGTHIPMQFHQFFSEANKGVQIKRGHSEDVTLLIGDNKYDARLTNIKRTNISSDTLQLRYDNNDKMKELVKNIFSLTYRITHKKDIISKSAKPDLIENSFEFMEFYKTDLPFEYRVKFKNLN